MTVTREKILALADLEMAAKRNCRTNLLAYTKYTFKGFDQTPFHQTYYRILDLFAKGKIKKLMISAPPQHGKSEGCVVRLPTMMIGNNPDLQIATICYSATKARKFGRKCKKAMSDKPYMELFDARLATRRDKDAINTAEEMEVVGHNGLMKVVGYQGGLTGDPVDVLLMDDLYKDLNEANSPVVRENVVEWYGGVADTRLHNDSQQLISFTRWHEDDLIGHIELTELVIEVKTWKDIEDAPKDAWIKINFEAIKTGEPTELDPRRPGEALYPKRHSIEKLRASRNMEPEIFEKLYQGNPADKSSLLYKPFKTYKSSVEYGNIIGKGNYTDVADEGKDFLCSVCYDKVRGVDIMGKECVYLLVTDVEYTSEPSEITINSVSAMLNRNTTRYANIESNAGGKGFAMMVKERTRICVINWFYQGKNKESRVITNAPLVNERIIMPLGWHTRWPKFYAGMTKFKAKFTANAHDDEVDCATGIVEKEILFSNGQIGIRRRN